MSKQERLSEKQRVSVLHFNLLLHLNLPFLSARSRSFSSCSTAFPPRRCHQPTVQLGSAQFSFSSVFSFNSSFSSFSSSIFPATSEDVVVVGGDKEAAAAAAARKVILLPMAPSVNYLQHHHHPHHHRGSRSSAAAAEEEPRPGFVKLATSQFEKKNRITTTTSTKDRISSELSSPPPSPMITFASPSPSSTDNVVVGDGDDMGFMDQKISASQLFQNSSSSVIEPEATDLSGHHQHQQSLR